ncbi:MAG: hypothetical protein KAH21_02710, partial [Spirochaetaceae bacterium]|nr:hypothetical protein [Spirochaetaceae bacterium]
PTLIVTRISDTRNELSSVSLNLSQSITVDYFPIKYNTDTLTEDMYNNQFNHHSWMSSQLNKAKNVMNQSNGSANLVVWAEMLYGGVVDFYANAYVNTSEGEQDLAIAADVYSDTESFINNTLPDFLEFSDMDVELRIVEEMFNGFLSNSGVKELLTNLDG